MGGKRGKKKQTPKEQGEPSRQTPPTPEGPQPSTRSTGDDYQHETVERPTPSSKGKKKQTSKEESEPSKQTPPTPQGPQPSTSTFSASDVKNQKSSRSTSDEHQHETEEWTTPSSRGKKTQIPQNQGRPSGQPSGASVGTQSAPESSQSKSGDHYHQRGKKTEQQKQQPAKGGQHQQQRGQHPDRRQERHDIGQPRQSGGDEMHSRRQDEYITRQQGSTREQQWRSKEQQTRSYEQPERVERKPFKEDTRPTAKQNQPPEGQRRVEGNAWFKQAPQSPRRAEEAPNVWRNPQVPRKEDGKREQRPEVATGAPDKVQPSSSTTSEHSSKPSTSQEPTMELVPVFKDPGTLARKRIRVQSNHFALDLGKLEVAYMYDVEIQEFADKKEKQPVKQQDKGKQKNNGNQKGNGKEGGTRKIKDKVKYKVLNAFLAKHFPDRNPSFDGQKNLYTSKLLTNNENDVLTDTGIVVEDDLGRRKSFSIVIKDPKELSLVPEVQVGTTHPPMLTKSAIQCIDIILRNAPFQYFSQIGVSFFRQPPEGKTIDLGGGMEMYYGFYQSVILGGRPLLNIHLAHKAFAKNIPVLNAFVEILNSKDTRRQHTYTDIASLQKRQLDALNEYIKSLKVAYVVPGSTKVVYRVNKLEKSPKIEQFLHNGVQKTVLEYFRSEKKYDILYPDIPLLWVGSELKKILVPPELCRIEKDQSVNRKLDDFYTRNMIKEAATDTHLHRENTMNRFQDARYNDSLCVKEFDFRVNDKFEEVDARILPTPQLEYRARGTAIVSKGTWQMKQFLVAKTIKKWSVVDISGDRFVNKAKIESFVMELKRAAKTCGINIDSEPDLDSVKGRNNAPSKPDLERYFKEQKMKNYDIIFVIIPSSNQGGTIYSYVKGAAEITAGCLTQCVTAKTVSGRFNGTTATNILLKVNGKLDGINHSFTLQSMPLVLQKYEPVMFLGADVTHPGRALGVPSVAAVTASHDPKAFQYNLRVRLQDSNLEDIIDLKSIVKQQLLFFYKRNCGIKPEAIIYFRDGVSEGQFARVLDKELRAIKGACKELPNYDPAITVLVVQKRHHTRLFPVNDRDSEDPDYKRFDRNQQREVIVNGNYNVPAGTCVDTHIVNPTMQNFYLVSHASIKGVARPTKYVTLYDDLDLSNDEIEELSYYLCHMFARCNRSVSYPAPTYYAHLGALRGKAYIKDALDTGNFDIDHLQKEMDKIKIQDCILNNNPMFFI